MPRGDKSKYTGKQERKADHIAEGYRNPWRARESRSRAPRPPRRKWARALEGELTDFEAATGFDRQYPTRYVFIRLVVLLQIELRVLTKRGLDAHAVSFDLPSRLIACSSGRSQSQ